VQSLIPSALPACRTGRDLGRVQLRSGRSDLVNPRASRKRTSMRRVRRDPRDCRGCVKHFARLAQAPRLASPGPPTSALHIKVYPGPCPTRITRATRQARRALADLQSAIVVKLQRLQTVNLYTEEQGWLTTNRNAVLREVFRLSRRSKFGGETVPARRRGGPCSLSTRPDNGWRFGYLSRKRPSPLIF
jgi:hypothetical protein